MNLIIIKRCIVLPMKGRCKMFDTKYSKAKKQIEKLLDKVQINLENNYKDLAITARAEAEQQLKQYKKQELLKEKDYQKLQSRLEEYTKRMEGYSHRLNVHF